MKILETQTLIEDLISNLTPGKDERDTPQLVAARGGLHHCKLHLATHVAMTAAQAAEKQADPASKTAE